MATDGSWKYGDWLRASGINRVNTHRTKQGVDDEAIDGSGSNRRVYGGSTVRDTSDEKRDKMGADQGSRDTSDEKGDKMGIDQGSSLCKGLQEINDAVLNMQHSQGTRGMRQSYKTNSVFNGNSKVDPANESDLTPTKHSLRNVPDEDIMSQASVFTKKSSRKKLILEPIEAEVDAEPRGQDIDMRPKEQCEAQLESQGDTYTGPTNRA